MTMDGDNGIFLFASIIGVWRIVDTCKGYRSACGFECVERVLVEVVVMVMRYMMMVMMA